MLHLRAEFVGRLCGSAGGQARRAGCNDAHLTDPMHVMMHSMIDCVSPPPQSNNNKQQQQQCAFDSVARDRPARWSSSRSTRSRLSATAVGGAMH